MIDTFVSFDIETTGLKPMRDKIIEIGAVKVKNKEIVDKFHVLINPGISLPERIVELTGINDAILKDKKECDEVLKQFLEFSEGYYILGHNILFDYSFIKVNASKMKLEFEKEAIDTLSLSRILHHELPSRTLENMCKYYGINHDHAHRAYDDAKATANLYFKLCDDFYDDRPELFVPIKLKYKIKKEEPVTIPQKNYLNDLLKYHKIEFSEQITKLSKSEASKLIDKIIFENGRII